MIVPEAQPVVYVKATCPHCLKLRLFLLEAGLQERVEIRSFSPGDEAEAAIRQELSSRFDKVTFPAIQIEPGTYLQDSDQIIDRLAVRYAADREALPIFMAYADSVLPRYLAVRQENRDLREALTAN